MISLFRPEPAASHEFPVRDLIAVLLPLATCFWGGFIGWIVYGLLHPRPGDVLMGYVVIGVLASGAGGLIGFCFGCTGGQQKKMKRKNWVPIRTDNRWGRFDQD